MINKIKGKLIEKKTNSIILENHGFFYEIFIPKTVFFDLEKIDLFSEVELFIYYYFNLDKNKAFPVMIGFLNEIEKEFFEKFIEVSGIGPRAALKALERPIPLIAEAIENADLNFLKSLEGIGKQKARNIIAFLQGKMGKFALIKKQDIVSSTTKFKEEFIEEAKHILKKLQYNHKEIDEMIEKALKVNMQINSTEELLNEVYRQRKK